ncbi:MAG TPA: HEAT repeat domain-containing protein [Terriglobales bacterium]|nr:HEAT repeat domain-containing protein [Terriglobales bacterium]
MPVRYSIAGSLILLLSLALTGDVYGQELEGRFYPDRSSYTLGEPLLFWIEIKNVGHEPVVLFEKGPGKCVDRFDFSVQRVSLQGNVSCSNTWDTKCGDKSYELKPGESYNADWPLNFWYRIQQPGDFKASLHRRVGVFAANTGWKEFSLKSDFEFQVTAADPAKVETVMRKFEADLQSKNPEVRHDALDVMATTAPPYMEGTILRLAHAEDAFTVLHAVEGLALLDTPEARAALAEVITTRHADGEHDTNARCLAIQALGKSRDSGYLTMLAPYAEHVDTCESETTINAIARLGQANAVGQLQAYLGSPKPKLRKNAAEGLRLTMAPEAVDALISALRDKDEDVRAQVSASLTGLTGHSIGESASPLQAENLWRSWWQTHRDIQLLEPPLDNICRL